MTVVVDKSDVTTVLVCPDQKCSFRAVSTVEAKVRQAIHDHMLEYHGSGLQKERETQRRWLSRKGLR